MTRTIPSPRYGDIHGVTPRLAAGGFYIHKTRTGRRVAVSSRTRQLLLARGQA